MLLVLFDLSSHLPSETFLKSQALSLAVCYFVIIAL
jgi:hypothetical protein